MAVKPWLGAIKEPTTQPKEDLKNRDRPPEERYQLEFAHGYKSDQVRQNLVYNAVGQPVYMTAALGIIFD